MLLLCAIHVLELTQPIVFFLCMAYACSRCTVPAISYQLGVLYVEEDLEFST